jgi:peptidoglycan/xylan/chitin deacetylase (PgdA/CDA1 family)
MSDVVVLCYHALSPDWDCSLAVTPAAFERQVSRMLARGWRPTTFTRAVIDPPAPRTLAITFDDAFASVGVHAAPALAELGAVATVFAPTGFIGSPQLRWDGIEQWAQGPHADELKPMGWEELGRLGEAGWEIGSHTVSHPHLTALDRQSLLEQLDSSRERCRRELGADCVSIAYPYGEVDERVAAAAAHAGYRAGATLSHRLVRLGPLRQPRIGVYRVDTAARFWMKTNRALRAWRSTPFWPLADGPTS